MPIPSHISRILVYSILFIVIAGGSAVLGLVGLVGFQVYWGDNSELKRSTILARINEETSIFTLDESTRLGSFFSEHHRRYVPISEVPAHMVRAMVASEDKNFYDHPGVDILAISSAFWDGVRNGFRFRRGGSSITQQTVKNILDRREHTFQRKFLEMIRAFQLEKLYSKNEILEFYLNQFHVTANGNGIGIAAKYYFNKDVVDLSLVEAAFIAGSVKAPSKYNPFTKYTKAAREKAWQRANVRKNYVLKRMYSQGWIDKDELESAWNEKVPFQKGSFTSNEVALVSLIRRQLNKKEILDALQLGSISELNHAGFKVFTTIDVKMQEAGQLMMRRNLSRLEFILKGFKTMPQEAFRPLRSLEKNEYYFGKVAHISQGPRPQLEIDFGLPVGVIAHESLKRTAKLLNLPTYKGEAFHLKEILQTLKVGDILLTEVMEYDKESQKAVLELRALPSLNGGLIAVDEGEVRAVVSGFEAKGFNRAMFARRQPGSVFKSVVYFAAMQLGWSILDTIDNQRRVFPYQGHFYYPRPDHASPYSHVSMLWAGVKSENLASIYLTAHLTDKLNFGQFKQVMGQLDLLPHPGEAVHDFHFRVSKALGVQLDTKGVREYLLGRAVLDLKPDLVFAHHVDIYKTLAKLWRGEGYLPELKTVLALPEEDISLKEKQERVELLKLNFERLNALEAEARKDWNQIQNMVLSGEEDALFYSEPGKELLSRFRVLVGRSRSPLLGYIRLLPAEHEYAQQALASGEPGADLQSQLLFKALQQGRPLNRLDVKAIWQRSGFLGTQANINIDDVRLDGKIPLRYIGQIRENLEARHLAVLANKDKYGLYRYFNHHDFRIAVGLNYVMKLSQSMGVYSPLEPVLSFPLGTNVVSVAEVAKIYQTFAEGYTYRFYEQGPENQLSFIRRIEDRDGNVLYEPKKVRKQLVNPCYASQMSEILRRVVTHGTGRRARGELQIDISGQSELIKEQESVKVRVPAFGKTGTTNDYTTAYFAGWIPYPVEERARLSMKNKYVIASYVGYDLNQTMRRGSYKISGAYGALPVWSDFGRAVLEEKNYIDYLDKLDLNILRRKVWPLSHHPCTRMVQVDLPHGTRVSAAVDGDDNEVYSATNIELDGELFVNEFARNASVRSYVDVASFAGGQPRKFELFERELEEESKAVDIPSEKDEAPPGGQVLGLPEKVKPEAAPPPMPSSIETMQREAKKVEPVAEPSRVAPTDQGLEVDDLGFEDDDGPEAGDDEQEDDATFKEEELW